LAFDPTDDEHNAVSAENPSAPSDLSSEAQGTRFGPLAPVHLPRLGLLSLAVLGLWAVWATGYSLLDLKSQPDVALLGVTARVLCWVLPAFAYLVSSYGLGWSQPIGLGFPYGTRQIVRAVLTTLVVGALLIFGTAVQFHTSPGRLLSELEAHARLELEAPVFEEIVFRGIITSEALTWASQSSKDWNQLRRRFWAALLGSALVFVLVHWPYYLMVKTPSAVLSDSLSLAVIALVLGFTFAQTRSVYVCIFLHWLNNALSALGGTFTGS
jgi:hypothetical protein